MRLYQHSLFRCFETEVVSQLKNQSQSIKLIKGQSLFLQGDEAKVIYYIQSGTVKILKTSIMGDEKIFSVYQQGSLIALSVLFNEPAQYPASAIAVEDSEVIAISVEALEKAIVGSEVATRAWFRHLNRRLENIQQMLTDQVFTEARDRFKKMVILFVKNSDQKQGDDIILSLPLTKQEMAELLSIRRETFSRLLSTLKAEGLCEVSAKQIRVNRKWLES